jgi:hypothetical protein
MIIIKSSLLLLFFIGLGFIPNLSYAQEEHQIGLFSGRVSKVNRSAEMVRVRVQFDNMKFLNKNDKIEFWLDHNPSRRCEAGIMGKTNDYLLVKIPSFSLCNRKVPFMAGSYIKIFSQDLINNIKVAQDLVELLLKKRMAIESQLNRSEKELDVYVERSESVNKRYQVLRAKLENEWQKELTDLENDKSVSLRNYNDLLIRKGEVDHKLEQYRISDKNLELDRWSLDPFLFTQK